MANLKVLDGDAAAKYLSTDGAGTDADPHVSHHVLDANTDGVYIGDIKFGEGLPANSGVDIGDVTINNVAGSGVYVQPGTSATWDVSDRAARLVGQVYGSQSAVLQQKVTTNDLIVTLDGETVSVTESSPISGFATSAKQLADGHNVTVDNAAGAAAVNIQDGGNTITVDGTVAATQSGTWNVGTVTTVTGVTTVSTLTTITNPVGIKNAAADTVTGISGTYDTIDVSLTNGTYRAIIDSSGYLTTNINGTITVDGSVTADTELPAAAALSDALANPTTSMIGAALLGYDNTNSQWERLRTNDSGVLRIVGNGTAGSADAAVVTVQGVASATPVIVTGDSAGSLTVDQATAANLKATIYGAGSAGSADAGVMTIQGIASMTPILATLQASDGTDIGNVDVASVIPGTGATNLGKAEDAQHASGDVGVMMLAVRNDTLATLVATDGDYAPLQVDASGALYVNLSGEGIDMDIEGVAAEDANAAGNPVLIGGRYDATPRTLDDTDVGAIALDADGAVHISDGGNTITVDGTVTATPSGIQEIEGDEAEGSGNLPQPVLIGGDDGTDIKNISVDATTGDVQVDVTNQVDVGGATPVVTPVTGNASPFSTSYAPSADFWLESITLHLSAAGTTSEAFTVTLNATDGGVYDTVLFSQDLSKGAVTDLVWVPEGGPMLFENGDAIDVAWNNAEGRTYGLRAVTRLA